MAGRELRRCEPCGFAWIVQGLKLAPNGRSIYENAEPAFFRDHQADYYDDETATAAARDKLTWVRGFVPSGARLLDVGANLGLFLREASRDYDATGIEPSRAVADWARRENNVRVQAGSIYDDNDALHGQLDAVTLFDVLEHLPDPEEALRRCSRQLRSGGHLFLSTPDIGSVMSRVLGRHWYYIDMDEHIALFNRQSLRVLLERTGFDVVGLRTMARRYRLSYVRRRLQYLGRQAVGMRIAHAAAWPLELWPNASVSINFGDVLGIVARRR